MFNASQAMAFRKPLKSSVFIESFLKLYRKQVPFLKQDEILHDDIEKSIKFLKNYDVAIEELFLNDYGVNNR